MKLQQMFTPRNASAKERNGEKNSPKDKNLSPRKLEKEMHNHSKEKFYRWFCDKHKNAQSSGLFLFAAKMIIGHLYNQKDPENRSHFIISLHTLANDIDILDIKRRSYKELGIGELWDRRNNNTFKTKPLTILQCTELIVGNILLGYDQNITVDNLTQRLHTTLRYSNCSQWHNKHPVALLINHLLEIPYLLFNYDKLTHQISQLLENYTLNKNVIPNLTHWASAQTITTFIHSNGKDTGDFWRTHENATGKKHQKQITKYPYAALSCQESLELEKKAANLTNEKQMNAIYADRQQQNITLLQKEYEKLSEQHPLILHIIPMQKVLTTIEKYDKKATIKRYQPQEEKETKAIRRNRTKKHLKEKDSLTHKKQQKKEPISDSQKYQLQVTEQKKPPIKRKEQPTTTRKTSILGDSLKPQATTLKRLSLEQSLSKSERSV